MESETQQWEIQSNNRKRPANADSPQNKTQPKTDKRTRTDTADDFIVYIFGKSENITRLNPIKTKTLLINSIGSVNNTYIIAKKYLKIYCKTAQQKDKLQHLKFLGDIAIEESISKNTTTNTATHKAVIVGVPDSITTEEICSETGAIKAINLYKGQGANKTLTSAVLLIYELTPPEYTYLGFNRYLLHDYKPKPMRCFNCQRYGHTANNCNNKQTCPACGDNHQFEHCTAGSKKCVNCGGQHNAGYRGCEKYGEVEAILKTSTTHKISYSDAAKLNKQQQTHKTNKQQETAVKIIETSKTNSQQEVAPINKDNTALLSNIGKYTHTKTTSDSSTQTDEIVTSIVENSNKNDKDKTDTGMQTVENNNNKDDKHTIELGTQTIEDFSNKDDTNLTERIEQTLENHNKTYINKIYEIIKSKDSEREKLRNFQECTQEIFQITLNLPGIPPLNYTRRNSKST